MFNSSITDSSSLLLYLCNRIISAAYYYQSNENCHELENQGKYLGNLKEIIKAIKLPCVYLSVSATFI